MDSDALTNPLGIKESARQDLIDCGIINGSNETSLSCNLTGPQWGTPTILIGLSPSGSLATWQLMSSMVGDHTFQVIEDMGSEAKKSARLFAKVFDAMGDGKCWLQHLLCHHQGRNCDRTWGKILMGSLYGFKWKPWNMTFGSGRSIEALRWLVRNPHVRVVHKLRNPLDMLVSRYKHKNNGVVAHCAVGDAACLESHRNARPMLRQRGGGLCA